MGQIPAQMCRVLKINLYIIYINFEYLKQINYKNSCKYRPETLDRLFWNHSRVKHVRLYKEPEAELY